MSMSEFFPPALVQQLPADFVSWANSALALGDARVKEWPLMNPYHALLVAGSYLILIALLVAVTKSSGWRWEGKGIILVHNFNLFALSAYMLFECVRQAVTNNYSLFGNSIDMSSNGLGMAKILYIFYLSKILEFGDTIIMALRGSYRQISFLHVYHHSSIFLVWWVIIYFAPGGESYFSAALNSGIHVFMYAYYFWSASQPKEVADAPRKKPTWRQPEFYKKYITSSQMTQFCIMMLQASYDLYHGVPNFPMFCVQILFWYMWTMLALFGNFFLQSYIKPKAKKTDGAVAKKSE